MSYDFTLIIPRLGLAVKFAPFREPDGEAAALIGRHTPLPFGAVGLGAALFLIPPPRCGWSALFSCGGFSHFLVVDPPTLFWLVSLLRCGQPGGQPPGFLQLSPVLCDSIAPTEMGVPLLALHLSATRPGATCPSSGSRRTAHPSVGSPDLCDEQIATGHLHLVLP